jgi:taurine dioxygenase
LEKVTYNDKGLLGDPSFKNLFANATDVFDYNPKLGTEVHGVDLANLSDAAKNDLALLIATRGVVFFRNQRNFSIDAQRKLAAYYGTLHAHATTAVPKRGDLDDVHVVYTDEKSKDQRAMFTPTFLWHSDVTYELQPPSYTSLKVLTGPPRGGGGDTLWSSQYAAYDALSASMQKYLESLTALHSSHMQAEGSKAMGRPVRRDPIITEHTLIRSHPVTGWKSLFFNPGFVTKIVGIPKMESDMIISYLNEVVTTTQELHVRFQWGNDDVALWDNRVTVSSTFERVDER